MPIAAFLVAVKVTGGLWRFVFAFEFHDTEAGRGHRRRFGVN